MADEPYLRIEGVNKHFGRFQALKDISLAIGRGEFVCFLGPSGCGKTTLLRIIAGLETQDGGRLHQGGKDISALDPTERDFGIVFQSYALFPNLTVADNVGFGLKNMGLGRSEIGSRVEEMLSLVGILDQGAKYPAQLSGGQQQRVALARALAMSPGLLLLDEPLSALDARVRAHLRSEVRELQRRVGVTTIMVTHDQEEALTMADRIAVMNEGRIEQIGDPLTIYREPATAFVARFVGETNALPAVLEGDRQLRMGQGQVRFSAAAAGLTPGASVTACLRPEDIVVSRNGAAAENCYPTRILSMEFLGSFYRARLGVPALGIDTLVVDLPAGQVSALRLESGEEVVAALPADRLRVFPAVATRED